VKSIYKSEEGAQRIQQRYLQFLHYWPALSKRHTLPTRYGSTFVIESGLEGAPALLLLHGTMANSSIWMRDVAAWFKHFRVFAVDIIGEAGLSAPARPTLASGEYALWLDDIMEALALPSVSIIGVSLGGWIALDFATKRPDRVTSLVLLAPAGIGRNKNILLWTLPLLMLGPWGARKVKEKLLGRPPVNLTPAAQAFADFLTLIFENMHPRTENPPIFGDKMLENLRMPTLVILGGKDVAVDSTAIKKRLQRLLPQANVRFLPEAGHNLGDQSGPIFDFLCSATAPAADDR
jgi:pimeloyl-ACP methyl ester carboxylesterase